MTDLQPPAPAPEPTSPPAPSAPTPAAPKTARPWGWIVGAICVGLCLCLGLCGGLVVNGVIQTNAERDKVELVVDQFMDAMAAQDSAAAYALFSPRAQRQTTLAALEKMSAGKNYVLFEGYRSVTVESLNMSAAFNTNPDLPQGTVAKVTGTIKYQGNFTGRFEAVLEQTPQGWSLHSINVTVPPDKFNP